ncbi:MAG: FtsX-like permease family protein [Pseudomonadota bacterium]|nr:FtsX-like permease family protein [Pseudomonadota bacterium]
MFPWLKLAYRNLLKNRRRSLFTLGAIAFGFAAINLLGGFSNYIFNALEDGYVYARGNGHLSIFKKDFHREGQLKPADYLLNKKELEEISALCHRDPRISIITPQLNISGLLSNGKISTIMMAEGRDPDDMRAIRHLGHGFTSKLKLFRGHELSDEPIYQVGVAKGLAGNFNLKIGDNVVVMTTTADGFMNAFDADIVQTIDAPLEILDNLLVSMPLRFTRELFDTRGADRLNLLLKNARMAYPLKKHLEQQLAARGLNVEIYTWDQLRPSYLKIRNMFNVIFTFVFIIVLTIVALSVVNTISMAVLERTREIGTLRALGLKRSGVVRIFSIEGTLLAAAGSFGGFFLTLLGWAAVIILQPSWTPPTIPKEVPLEIHLVPWLMVVSCLAMIGLAALAAIIPARRAAGLRVIEALRHI